MQIKTNHKALAVNLILAINTPKFNGFASYLKAVPGPTKKMVLSDYS